VIACLTIHAPHAWNHQDCGRAQKKGSVHFSHLGQTSLELSSVLFDTVTSPSAIDYTRDCRSLPVRGSVVCTASFSAHTQPVRQEVKRAKIIGTGTGSVSSKPAVCESESHCPLGAPAAPDARRDTLQSETGGSGPLRHSHGDLATVRDEAASIQSLLNIILSLRSERRLTPRC
jgi:hypothetical protein